MLTPLVASPTLRAALAALAVAAVATAALAQAPSRVMHHTLIRIAANQSSNWSGYDVGSLDDGDTLFTSITGQWRVPTASPRSRSDSEYSANWIGIGGGCVNASCSISDSATLIQVGTEADTVNGTPQYSAWWETIPAPSTTIAGFSVVPGDIVYASLAQGTGDIWTIVLRDLTRHESFSTTTPYPSSELSAEWITETPVVVGTSGTGVATLPNLSRDTFDKATLNGRPAALNASEELQLSPSSGVIAATPSAPDSDRDGFNDCSYRSSCATFSS